MSFGSWLKGQFNDLAGDLADDVRKTYRYIRKQRRYKSRTHVAGFEYKTVKVVRIKRTVWEIHHHPQGVRQAVLVERLRAHQSEVLAWAREQENTYIFLWKLQSAMNAGKLTPERYYRILNKWGGCKRDHIHSQYCKYHKYH